MDVLRLEGVEAGYGRFKVLYGVDLEVGEAEVVVLLGPNGAGKSTLLNAIAGLADVYAGRVLFVGEDITGLPPHEAMKRGIGYVMQSVNNFGTANIFGELTVWENLIAASAGIPRAVALERMEEIYQVFPKLRELRDRRARFLSGGERQMLAIGMGLMRRPRLLMLDEPTSGLAPKLVDEFFRSVKEIRERFKLSILLVEQNARKALEVGDRAYVLVTGRMKYAGPAAGLSEEKLGDLFMGR